MARSSKLRRSQPPWRAALSASIPVRLALLALLATLAYGASLSSGVAWDDTEQVSGNPAIRTLLAPWHFFTDPWTLAPRGGDFLAQYRPLRTLAYALQFAVFGGSAWGFHLVSLLLHAAGAWLVNRTNPEYINYISKIASVSPVFAQILVNRGLKTADDISVHLNPCLTNLSDPIEIQGMKEAVERIMEASRSGEKVLVHGDYDVDGTTSVAMVYSFIRKYHREVDYYITDRYAEGYGISFMGMDYASKRGVTLVIALDCGIKSIDKVLFGREHGIDLIICDHHTPGEFLPDAVAVLNPESGVKASFVDDPEKLSSTISDAFAHVKSGKPAFAEVVTKRVPTSLVRPR